MAVEQYSKYVRAAMDQSDTVADAVAARSDERDVPPPDFELRPIHSSGLPGISQTHTELVAALREKHYSDDLDARAGVQGMALWLARRSEGVSDATDAALCRIDALAERQARYRAATGRRARGERIDAKKKLRSSVRSSILERVSAAAALRGEPFCDTLDWLIECGLTLMDERAKRYEAFMMQQLLKLAHDGNPFEAVRYLDPSSASLPRAHTLVEPLSGAPSKLALLAQQFPHV